MTAPALMIGWELWAKNRPGIVTVAAGLVATGATSFLFSTGRGAGVGVSLSAVLFFLAALYLLAVVIHCEFDAGRLRLGLPTRFYTLPVRTGVLVGWLMLYGLGALAALWLAAAALVWLPAGIEPAWWLVPLLAVALVWFQAVCWAVPGPPLAKVLAACLIFPALKFALEMVSLAVVLYVNHDSPTDPKAVPRAAPVTLTVFAGCFIPLAYAVAVVGVARARRGAGGGWAWGRELLGRVWAPSPQAPTFRSPARALVWLEWRRKGRTLPLFPAGFLLFLTVIVAPVAPAPGLLAGVLTVTGLGVVVAFFVGYGFGKTGFWGSELGLSVFEATRPVGSGTLAFARIGAAGLSALATTAVITVGVPVWLGLLGRWDEAVERVTAALPGLAGVPPGASAALVVVGLFAITWGQLVAGMVPALTGRGWVVNGVVAAYLTVAVGLGVLARYVYTHPDAVDSSVRALTWACGCLVGLKLVAAGWAARAAGRRGLLPLRQVAIVLGTWSVAAGCLLALACLLLPTVARPLAVAAVLLVPLVRVTAAPLAVAWSRHR